MPRTPYNYALGPGQPRAREIRSQLFVELRNIRENKYKITY